MIVQKLIVNVYTCASIENAIKSRLGRIILIFEPVPNEEKRIEKTKPLHFFRRQPNKTRGVRTRNVDDIIATLAY